jgi:hypothetical protein
VMTDDETAASSAAMAAGEKALKHMLAAHTADTVIFLILLNLLPPALYQGPATAKPTRANHSRNSFPQTHSRESLRACPSVRVLPVPGYFLPLTSFSRRTMRSSWSSIFALSG